MKTQAIIPAAGSGERMHSTVPKLFIELKGKPLVIHTLEVFEKCALIDSIVLVVNKDLSDRFKELIRQHQLTKISKIVSGGQTRAESITNGFKEIDSDTQYVVVHDAARPLADIGLLEKTIRACEQDGAVVAAVPVKNTIKQVRTEDRIVEMTLDRSRLWEVQTPQVFKRSIFQEAYGKITDFKATDDATLVEELGYPVKIIEGDYKNIKVTTAHDIKIAEALQT